VAPTLGVSADDLDQARATPLFSRSNFTRDNPSPAQGLSENKSFSEFSNPLNENWGDELFGASFPQAWRSPTGTRLHGLEVGRMANDFSLSLLSLVAFASEVPNIASSPAPASATASTNPDVSASNLPAVPALTQPVAAVHPGPITQPGDSFATTGPAAATNALGRLPLDFEANRGQSDPQVRFLARGPGYTLFLTATEAVMVLPKPVTPPATAETTPAGSSAPEASVLRMQLVGANPSAAIAGQQELPGKSNYFKGNDSAKWVTNVPHFSRVTYQGVYPGVDLVYYGSGQRQLEYDWVVAPGANPSVIRLAYQGAEGLRLDEQGNLVVQTASGEMVQHAPLLYQEVNGVRQNIAGRFVLDAGQVGVAIGAYDASRTLVVDPTLSYSTYLGGTGTDQANGIGIDSAGNTYIAGRTTSTNFPTANALYNTYQGGPVEAFVSKLSADGQTLLYSTYLGGSTGGGSGANVANGIAVDAAGNAYVTGNTQSQDFPTFHAFQANLGRINGSNAFLTKLSTDGSALLYSSYLGGTGGDVGKAIAVDSNGRAYVTGSTTSSDFPTRNPLQSNKIGFQDAFVAKFDPSQSGFSSLIYSTYYGGNSVSGNGIAVDANGDAFVTGTTGSTVLRTTANAYQSQIHGFNNNAFIAEFNPSDSDLLYGSFFGGTGTVGATEGDVAYGIALDGAGNASITGSTTSSDFPTKGSPVQPTYGGGQHNAFVAKFDTTQASGPDTLVYSTYLGGGGDDVGKAIAVDATGDAYVTGSTTSSGSTPFPTTVYADQPALGGDSATNMFVTELNVTGSELVYSSYLGGNMDDEGMGIAVDNAGNAYVAGFASSMGLATANALQPGLAGPQNAFLAVLAIPQLKVVNVIPTGESGETDQNSEPSIAVSPSQTNNLLISAFGRNPAGGVPNPYFTSANGGNNWDHFAFNNYPYMDTTVAWSPSAQAYAAVLAPPRVVVGSSPNPQVNNVANAFMPVANSAYMNGQFNPDQPHLIVTNVGGNDRVYVGINDLNRAGPPIFPAGMGNGQTAMVRFSLNAGVANPMWTNVIIDNVGGMAGADGPVYMAANGNTVYALYPRFNVQVNNDVRGDLIIVRDDAGGANNFNDLRSAIPPASGVVFPFRTTMLGQNRLDSSYAIAVNPTNDAIVYIAWADVNAMGMPQVHIARSGNGGGTWAVVLNLPAGTGLPALAVANNGTVGLLYTQLTAAGNLETHFAQSRNDFTTRLDNVIATFPNNEFQNPGQPYIGDYEGLVVVGNKFFGTFSASNNPLVNRFPRGVFFQRNVFIPGMPNGVVQNNFNLLKNGFLDDGSGPPPMPGLRIDPSIDPYFFTVAAV
jgi:hypothetical protein